MSIIHLTQKLARSIGVPRTGNTSDLADETILGPWTAKPIYLARKRYVLFINDRTLLTALVSYAPKDTLFEKFADNLQLQLESLFIEKNAARREAQSYRNPALDTKTNRSILGSLNDMAYQYFTIL